MRRLRSLGFVVGSILLAVTVATPAAAQDEAMPSAGHPFVGVWLVQPFGSEPPYPFIASADGLVIDGDPVNGTGYGGWAATGDRTADVMFVAPMVDPEAGLMGYVTIRVEVEVSEDGQGFTGTWTAEFPAEAAEAMGMPVGELGPNDVSAIRMVVEPMGVPVAPMPEMEEAPTE